MAHKQIYKNTQHSFQHLKRANSMTTFKQYLSKRKRVTPLSTIIRDQSHQISGKLRQSMFDVA